MIAMAVCRNMVKVRNGQDTGYIFHFLEKLKVEGGWVACRDKGMV